MKDKEFQQDFKNLSDELGRKTIYKILKKDVQYQKNRTKLEEAEEKYSKLLETMPSEQRLIIEQFVSCKDAVNTEYCSVSYLAGMKNMCQIIQYLD